MIKTERGLKLIKKYNPFLDDEDIKNDTIEIKK
jgi:hypothetical protein